MNFNSFYRVYPQIREAMSREWGSTEISTSPIDEIFRSLTGKSPSNEIAGTIVRSATGISPVSGRLLVEYALAGMDNRIFVSKYQLQLPKPDELQRYIEEQRRLLETGGNK